MRTEELIKELNTLPRGYISRKRIKGKEYSYLQALEGDKLKSTYLRESEVEFYQQGIARRKELEAELKAVGEAGKAMPALSKRARELSGSLMSGDVEVARFESGEPVWIDPKRAPLMILRTGSLAGYLASRAVDSSRTNSRLLKKVMDIHGEPDEMVSLFAHGATITDNVWFRTKGSKLKYEDIRFDSDAYSEIALDGKVFIYNKRSRLSPQLTLGGSYEKCWKLIDGEWWLYKRGNQAELYSELVSSRIAALLGVPTAEYEIEDGYIRTRNFVSARGGCAERLIEGARENVEPRGGHAERLIEGARGAVCNFEPMLALCGDDDRIATVYAALESLAVGAGLTSAEAGACAASGGASGNASSLNSVAGLTASYLKLLIFDAIVKNEDRHNENCGLLRDSETGEVLGLAPNFDNNLSLVARSDVLNMDPAKDGLIQHLLKFIRGNERAAAVCREIVLNDIDEESVRALAEGIDEEQLAKFIVGRYRYLQAQLAWRVG